MKPSGIRFVLIGSAIAMAIAGFGVFSYTVLNSEKSQSTAIASPSPDGAADAVSALGRLEPEGGVVKIASPSAFGTARVSKVLVKEGTQVQLNQPLAVMDEGDTLYASLVQAEAQVKEAQTKLAQVQAGAKPGDINAQRANVLRASAEIPKAESALLAANAEVRNAQSEYDRYRQLSKEGAVTASDLETRRLTLETKAQQQDQARQVLEQSGLALEQAKQELNSVAEVRPTDIQQAKAQVDVAVANFRKAKTELDKAIVRARSRAKCLKSMLTLVKWWVLRASWNSAKPAKCTPSPRLTKTTLAKCNPDSEPKSRATPSPEKSPEPSIKSACKLAKTKFSTLTR